MFGVTKYTIFPTMSQRTYSRIATFHSMGAVFNHLQFIIQIEEAAHCNKMDMLPEMFCLEMKNIDNPCSSGPVWRGQYSVIHRRLGKICEIEVIKEVKLDSNE